MPVSMYSVSIPVFIQHLNGLSSVLDKAAAWATARKINEADLLNMRLSPDMFNLTRQVRAATDHAANAAGRLSGKELLKFANDETTIAQLKERIAKTIDYLKSVKQSEVDGTEGKEIKITFPNGNPPVHRPEPAARQRAAELLFPCHHRLRHHSAVRRRTRQARLHGQPLIAVAAVIQRKLMRPPPQGERAHSLPPRSAAAMSQGGATSCQAASRNVAASLYQMRAVAPRILPLPTRF